MPNGGDPEECAKAEAFYGIIKGDLESFAQENGLRLVPWYHDAPIFILERPEERVLGYSGIARTVQVYLKVRGREAIVSVFSINFSDREGRRIKSIFVAKGSLPNDKERMVSWLKCARAISSAVVYSDLWTVSEWYEKNPKLEPLFD